MNKLIKISLLQEIKSLSQVEIVFNKAFNKKQFVTDYRDIFAEYCFINFTQSNIISSFIDTFDLTKLILDNYNLPKELYKTFSVWIETLLFDNFNYLKNTIGNIDNKNNIGYPYVHGNLTISVNGDYTGLVIMYKDMDTKFIDLVNEVLTFREETICTIECFLGITLSEATIDSLKRISVIDDTE